MKEFTRESIIQAIKKIDQNPDLRKGRASTEYDLVFEDRKYPPVLVLSEAHKLLGGFSLTLEDFNNTASKAFKILSTLGFEISEKLSNYSIEIKKFIEQSNTSNLKTIHYINSFEGLKVSVSFGQGHPANIPWIAFLANGQSVQKGIYPVYLLFKSNKLLILAYGVSVTKKPDNQWQLTGEPTVEEFFRDNNLGKPFNYGSSFVYAYYDISAPLELKKMNDDLHRLVKIYLDQIDKKKSVETSNTIVGFNYSNFLESSIAANLLINQKLFLRFIAALITKPFVILTGLSGSGKTKLAQSFASWICKDENQYCIIPVGADWTNREPLLGFPSALDKNQYVKPENGLLDLIILANINKTKPYFLILDEMNLSHVERYFADFLSVMESSSYLTLHSNLDLLDNVPSRLLLPKNLFVIGTVNIDETTYMFSPKVLDRANVIEFRVSSKEMELYLSNYHPIDLNMLHKKGSEMGEDFVRLANDKIQPNGKLPLMNSTLVEFFNQLKIIGAEFGYRTAAEIIRFANVVSKIEPSWSIDDTIDAAIMQKLLPKVHGSKRKLEPVLKALGALCLTDKALISEYFVGKKQIETSTIGEIKYPISLEKILRMQSNLLSNGFTSFAEA